MAQVVPRVSVQLTTEMIPVVLNDKFEMQKEFAKIHFLILKEHVNNLNVLKEQFDILGNASIHCLAQSYLR